MATPLEDAFDELVTSIADAADTIRGHPLYGEPENRAAGHMLLVNMLLARLEEHVVFDPEFPTFRVVDPRSREGGDNADQRYLISRLTGGATYRIWGTLGGVRRLDVQIYAGDPFDPGSGGRSASFLDFAQLAVDGDGAFEVFASSQPRDGNWLENPPDGTMLIVRQIFSDWEREAPGEVHVDRVGNEGELRPVLTEEDLAARFRTAADDLRAHARIWPAMVTGRYLDRRPNELSPPSDPGALGGVPGRWMCGGVFDLAGDEALVVRTWPADGNYQGIQLTDLWYSSLEYQNRQTSLTGDQAHLATDGSYYFVVCGTDPGVPNWLDTVGRRRGVVLLRFDGASGGAFDPAQRPTATKVPLGQLRAHLPEDTPVIGPRERADAIAARRRHVQRRFGS